LRRALPNEHNPAAAWVALPLLLIASDRLHAPLWPYGIALAVVAAAWLAAKGWKHRWLHGNFIADFRRRLRETAR